MCQQAVFRICLYAILKMLFTHFQYCIQTDFSRGEAAQIFTRVGIASYGNL